MGLKPGFYKSQIHPNTIRQIFFLALLIFIGLIIVRELYFMIGSFFGAITLYIILMHSMKYLVIIRRWKSWVAALSLMLLSLIIMVIPFIYMTKMAIERILPVINDPSVLKDVVNRVHQYLYNQFQIDLLNSDNADKISSQILPFAQKMLGGTFSALGNMVLMYLVLFFLLIETGKVQRWLRQNLPFKTVNVKKIMIDIKGLVYSNALGIPIVALVQGVAGIVGYWIFGVEEFILMGILTAISSVIPIMGTFAVYMPLAIYQFTVVDTFQGVGVALWGIIVIGTVDNVARLLLQKKLSDAHPLITLLGVIIGINLFGFIGVIFGPLMLSVFFILAGIYIDEFGKVDANMPDQIRPPSLD
jgi:predicted PurR-regulated permease PerM